MFPPQGVPTPILHMLVRRIWGRAVIPQLLVLNQSGAPTFGAYAHGGDTGYEWAGYSDGDLGGSIHGEYRTPAVLDTDVWWRGYIPERELYGFMNLVVKALFNPTIHGIFQFKMLDTTQLAIDIFISYDGLSEFGTYLIRPYLIFRNVSGVSPNYWDCVTREWDGTEQVTTTDVLLDTSVHKFEIIYDKNAVKYYIDGVLKATHTPPSPARTIIKSLGFVLRTKEDVRKRIRIGFVGMAWY